MTKEKEKREKTKEIKDLELRPPIGISSVSKKEKTKQQSSVYKK